MDEVGLTVHERAVLAAAVTSPGNAAVAETLGMTPAAVRSSLVAIKAKLGARSKLEAVVIAFRRGLLDLPTTSVCSQPDSATAVGAYSRRIGGSEIGLTHSRIDSVE
jgi:DNA-binding CsgD family transcriptional regulator